MFSGVPVITVGEEPGNASGEQFANGGGDLFGGGFGRTVVHASEAIHLEIDEPRREHWQVAGRGDQIVHSVEELAAADLNDRS